MSEIPKNLVFFGHHKCGSRLFRKVIMRGLARANDLEVIEYKSQDPPFHFEILHDLDFENIDFTALGKAQNIHLNLSNAGVPVVQAVKAHLKAFKGVHVIRDPRQILVSSYFHHLEGHPEENGKWYWDRLAYDRRILKSLNLEKGVLYELDNITRDIIENQILPWETDDRILELKLEDINAKFDAVVADLVEFLDLKTKPYLEISFGSTFVNANSQRWQDVFTPRIKAIFKERYGQLLVDLGYEKTLDW